MRTLIRSAIVAVAISTTLLAPATAAAAIGDLTAGSPATIATGSYPLEIDIAPDGTSVYVVNRTSDNVSAFARDTQSGALTPIVGSPFAAGSSPRAIAIAPDGRFVYVTNVNGNSVSVFERDTTTGALQATTPATVAVGSEPFSIEISKDGRFAYVVDATDDTILVLARDVDSGALTVIDSVASNGSPMGVTISPDDRSLYVVSDDDDVIVVFERQSASGLLTAASPATVPVGLGPVAIAIAPDGRAAYVSHQDGTIRSFRRDLTTGALSDLQTISGALVLLLPDISSDGRSVIVPDLGLDSIRNYDRDAQTSLLAAAAPATLPTGDQAFAVRISPDGTSVYVTNRAVDTVSVFQREAGFDVSVSASGATGVTGASTTASFEVTNDGPGPWTGGTIRVALPTGVSFQGSGTSPGCTMAASAVTCAIDAQTDDASQTFRVGLRLDAAGSYSIPGTVSGSLDNDMDTANNAATATVTVTDPATTTTPGSTCPSGTSTGVSCTQRANGNGLIITGTGGIDTLIGSAGDDVIRGGSGDDTLAGLAGDDRLIGGFGSDRLVGGAGDDLLVGGSHADTLLGLGGDDILNAGTGWDRAFGGAGNDRLLVIDRRRDARVNCGAGRDTVLADFRLDTPRWCQREIFGRVRSR